MFTRALAAAAAFGCLIAAPAMAEPPAPGFYGHVTDRPVLQCWKEADLRELIGEYQADFNAGVALFVTQRANRACGIIPRLGPVAVGETEAMGTIDTGKGKRIRVWMVHVGNANKHTWIVYDEPDPGLEV